MSKRRTAEQPPAVKRQRYEYSDDDEVPDSEPERVLERMELERIRRDFIRQKELEFEADEGHWFAEDTVHNLVDSQIPKLLYTQPDDNSSIHNQYLDEACLAGSDYIDDGYSADFDDEEEGTEEYGDHVGLDEEEYIALEDDDESEWQPDEIEEAEEEFIETADDDDSILPSVSTPKIVSGLKDEDEAEWKPGESEQEEEEFIEGANDNSSILPSTSTPETVSVLTPEIVSVSAINCYAHRPNNHMMGLTSLSISISTTQIDDSWTLTSDMIQRLKARITGKSITEYLITNDSNFWLDFALNSADEKSGRLPFTLPGLYR